MHWFMHWVSMIETAFVAWIVLLLGAMVGSFLNVVAYRLPLGRSVVVGRSHCPACGGQIPARDNIPVFGWILLGGRCRRCNAPISARYPVVEAVCAGVFLLVFVLEVAGGGRNLPFGPVDPAWGAGRGGWTGWEARGDLLAMFLYHVLTFCLLLTWGLIGMDRQRIPPRHVAAALGLAAVLPAVLPSLHPVSAAWPFSCAPALGARAEFVDWCDRAVLVPVLGALTGWFAGWFAGAVLGFGVAGFGGRAAALSLVGIVFGWQAVVGTLAIAAGLITIDRAVSATFGVRPRLLGESTIVAAAMIHLAVWRQLVAGFLP